VEQRFWEVDAARGVAIAMMVVYHLTYDLDYFGGYDIESTSGFWARFADATAGAFLFLVGVSLAISYSRATAGRPGRSLFGKYLLRGIRILAYGMALTVVFLVFGMGVVAFGILHLIGVSIILAYPLLRYRYVNLFLGLSIIAVGVYIGSKASLRRPRGCCLSAWCLRTSSCLTTGRCSPGSASSSSASSPATSSTGTARDPRFSRGRRQRPRGLSSRSGETRCSST
jgi:uncharacterized membrane protein